MCPGGWLLPVSMASTNHPLSLSLQKSVPSWGEMSWQALLLPGTCGQARGFFGNSKASKKILPFLSQCQLSLRSQRRLADRGSKGRRSPRCN